MSMLADVLICNLLLLRSLVIRCRYEGENIVSSENKGTVPVVTIHVKKTKKNLNLFYVLSYFKNKNYLVDRK